MSITYKSVETEFRLVTAYGWWEEVCEEMEVIENDYRIVFG